MYLIYDCWSNAYYQGVNFVYIAHDDMIFVALQI